MDFFQRNMDTIKSKLPQISSVPKFPKLKKSKIFSNSRDNISPQSENGHQQEQQFRHSHLQIPSPSGAVDLTPSRIGTISSLVDGAQQSNFDIPDEFIGRSPMGGRRRIRFSDSNTSDMNQLGFSGTNIDNIRDRDSQQQSAGNSKERFTEKLTRQYKELSEFKLSHLFGKKTVVRKTEIEVNTYIQGFQRSDDGIDNHTYRHDESGFGSAMNISQNDLYNRKRRISDISDFSVEFKTLPPGADPSPLPKPKAAVKMPPIPDTPDRIPTVCHGRSPTIEIQLPKEKFVQPSPNETPITAPLAKRKIYTPEEPESLESINTNDFDSAIIPGSGYRQKSAKLERKSSTKSGKSNTSNPGTPRSRTGSQRCRGMWEIRRPIRIKATAEDFKNPVDINTLDATPDFRKTLSNVFKKFHSNNAVPEHENPPVPKPSTLRKIQKSVKIRTKSEPKSATASEGEEESELKKQFNKIKNNTEKLKSLIKTDTENVSTTYGSAAAAAKDEESLTVDVEDPAKAKSIEEIEKMGYGRKNLKYIEKWRIRRRRELRRNEPFPTNKSEGESDVENKGLGTADTENEASESSQLAELKKSLAKALKKRHLAREVSTDSVSGDEQQQLEQQQSQATNKKGFGSLFRKQPLKTSLSVEDNLDGTPTKTPNHNATEPEQKVPFWKKKTLKQRISTEDVSISSENILGEGESNDAKPEVAKKTSLLDKAKNKVEKLKAMKKSSVDSSDGDKSNEKPSEKSFGSPAHKMYLEALDDVDEETARAIEEMERNCAKNTNGKQSSTWQKTKIMTSGEFSSGSEESLTTPGFLAHDNAPDSETYVSSEPTVIIMSGPMPGLMTLPSRVPNELRHLYPNLESEKDENCNNLLRPSSPTPFQKPPITLSAPNQTSKRSPMPAEALNANHSLNMHSTNRSKPPSPSPEFFERPRSSSPGFYAFVDAVSDSPPPRSNLIKSAGFHDLASASLSSPFESPVLGRRDYQSLTQPPSLSPATGYRRNLSPGPPQECPPPLPSSSPPLLDISKKIYPDMPDDFEETLGISSEILLSHRFNFKTDALQVILESPTSATNSIDICELPIESPTTPPFESSSSTPFQSPPIPKRTIPSPKVIEEIIIPKLNSPIAKVHQVNEKHVMESNLSAIPRPRHSRKPSMDKPLPLETPAAAMRNSNRSPIIGINKIEEKNDKSTSRRPEQVKKWSSIDIFNGNDEVFTDFDEELKHVPIIPITVEQSDTLLKSMNEGNRECKSMSPTLEKSSSDLLVNEATNCSEDMEYLAINDDTPQGVPTVPERHKPARPVVKQASLRRQFSNEKDSEDLNKNIDVNKLRSKFETTNTPPRPAERMSFRKYERVLVTSVIENNQQMDTADDSKSNEFVITKTETATATPASAKTDLPPPLLPRKSKLIKQPTSLEVETDGSECSTADIYEPICDFVGGGRGGKQTIPNTDVQLTSTATLKAIQAKQQYEANLKAEKQLLKSKDDEIQSSAESSPTSRASSSATSILSAIETTTIHTEQRRQQKQQLLVPVVDAGRHDDNGNEANKTELIIGKSSTAKIVQHQQQLQLMQEEQKELQQQQRKGQMPLKQSDINQNSVSSVLAKSNAATDNNKPQCIAKMTTPGIIKTTTSITYTNADIQQQQQEQTDNRPTKVNDEGHSFNNNNERMKMSDLKKDEMFYSLDDEEYQQYSLSGPTIVKELYSIEI